MSQRAASSGLVASGAINPVGVVDVEPDTGEHEVGRAGGLLGLDELGRDPVAQIEPARIAQRRLLLEIPARAPRPAGIARDRVSVDDLADSSIAFAVGWAGALTPYSTSVPMTRITDIRLPTANRGAALSPVRHQSAIRSSKPI